MIKTYMLISDSIQQLESMTLIIQAVFAAEYKWKHADHVYNVWKYQNTTLNIMICKVNKEIYEQAKKFRNRIILNEDSSNNKISNGPGIIFFKPRENWSDFFETLDPII